MWTSRRQVREGHRPIFPVARSRCARCRAAQVPDRAVIADDVLRACALVESIDILSDEGEPVAAAPLGDDVMCRIRLARCDARATPVVPFPDEPRVACECLRRREILRSERFPQSLRPRKVGTPLAADTPAPVTMVSRFAAEMRLANSRIPSL
jgi:hypothetical protein